MQLKRQRNKQLAGNPGHNLIGYKDIFFFTLRVVKHYNRLPRDVVDDSSLETFMVRLEGALSNLI